MNLTTRSIVMQAFCDWKITSVCVGALNRERSTESPDDREADSLRVIRVRAEYYEVLHENQFRVSGVIPPSEQLSSFAGSVGAHQSGLPPSKDSDIPHNTIAECRNRIFFSRTSKTGSDPRVSWYHMTMMITSRHTTHHIVSQVMLLEDTSPRSPRALGVDYSGLLVPDIPWLR